MQVDFQLEGFAEAIAKLNGNTAAVHKEWARLGFDVGEQAVGFIQKEYRSGPGSDRVTQVRSGRQRRAYAEQVRILPDAVAVDVGLIKPGTDAQTLYYEALHEGFNRAGEPIESWTINAKPGGWLTFPVYRKDIPGRSAAAIEGWVRTKKVTQYPHPALPAAREKFTPTFREGAEAALFRVVS